MNESEYCSRPAESASDLVVEHRYEKSDRLVSMMKRMERHQ